MAAPALFQPPPPSNAARPRRSHRWALWVLGLALCGVLTAFVTRSILIHQMRLPRLTLYQGGNVECVSITPDGKTVFSGGDSTHKALQDRDNKPADVFVWDATSGQLVRRLHGFYWRSEGVAASPDGKTVVASGVTSKDSPGITHDKAVAYDWKTGHQLWAIEGIQPFSYSSDGRLVGVANELHDSANGRLVKRLSDGVESDGQTGFSPDGRFFGYIGATTQGKNGHSDSDNGDKLFYSTTRLHLWQLDKGKEACDFPFIRVRAFDFSRDSRWLVMTSDADGMAGGTDGSVVRRVDIQTGAVVWARERSMNASDNDEDAVFNSLVVSPNGKCVILQSTSDHLVVLDAATGREMFRPRTIPNQQQGFWALPGGLAFSADGKTLVSRCGPKVLVWDTSSLQ